MSLQEIIESFRTGLMLTGLWVLAAIVAGCIGIWLYRSAHSTTALLRRLRTWIDGIVFTLLFTACVLIGGTKTNSPPMGLMVPLPPSLPQSVVQTVTDEDIARGHREVAETNCEASVYAMPEGITPSFNWHKRGTFGEWALLDLGDFAFPLGTNDGAVTSFSVFNDGRIRPTPRDAAREICAVGVPMLAMQGASRFWVADVARPEAAPYQSKLLTWENFFLNADTNTPVNAQIELFQNGDFTTRSNALERIYRRVAYFDWDGDGLENTVDPDPLVAGADAHGTNAEWYNVVCSNVLDAVAGDGGGPTLSWLEGVNSNAYYFVDVVATNGPAPIYFTGDRESRLGNPVVVALGGETNHVPLLIGIDYAITSPVPFTVSFPDDGFVTVTTNGVANYELRWPLEFSVSPDGNGGFYTSAIPYDPGGEFSWSASGGGLNMRSASVCSYTSVSNWIGFTCGTGGNCGCDGCSVDGTYSVESAVFALPSLWCGCCVSESISTNDPPSAPSVSVSFDKAVVFYEDTYTNAPNDVVAKHSTNVTLTVSAYGGEAGGMLYVSEQNIGKLVRTGGKAIAFPYTAFVPPQSGVSFSIEYEAETHSDSQNDISVSASVSSAGSGSPCTASASITAAEILIEAEAFFPTNKHRHVFGPAERVTYSIDPPGVSFTLQGNVPSQGEHDHLQGRIVMPFCASQFTMEVVNANVSLPLTFAVIEPEAELHLDNVRLPTAKDWSEAIQAAPLTEGAIGSAFHADMSLRPNTVSFANIILMEGEAAASDIHGFFTNSIFNGQLNHDIAAGAYREMDVHDENIVGTGDNAFLGLNSALLPYLRDGDFTLQIPLYWYVDGGVATNTLIFLEARNFVYQNADVKVCKYNVSAIRGTNDVTNIQR